jgi:hypothetical protein
MFLCPIFWNVTGTNARALASQASRGPGNFLSFFLSFFLETGKNIASSDEDLEEHDV